MLLTGGHNAYTIEKNGVRKMIYQSAWKEAGPCSSRANLFFVITMNNFSGNRSNIRIMLLHPDLKNEAVHAREGPGYRTRPMCETVKASRAGEVS